jgi:hypothetical protein
LNTDIERRIFVEVAIAIVGVALFVLGVVNMAG